jgi:hypothetical protein
MFVILHVYRKTWKATYYFEYILARHTSGLSISEVNVSTQPPYGYCSCEGPNSHASYVYTGWPGVHICLLVKKCLCQVDTLM